MRTQLVTWLAIWLSTNCAAAEIEKQHYLGEATLSSESGQPRGSQVILLEKIHDPGQSLIVERAIVVQATDQPAEEHTMTMKASDDRFTISDARLTVHGTGKLFGPAWHWTYFRATYESTNGARIEDENFMNDPSVSVARKKIMAPDGKVLICINVALKAITPEAYRILSANLLKKDLSSEKKHD